MITIDAREKTGDHPLHANEHASIERYQSASGERGARASQALDFGTFVDQEGVSSPLNPTDYIVTDENGGNIRRFSAGEFEALFIPE
jgi:hypothetical protein